METPSSTRRVTRSQALAGLSNIPTSRKNEESEKALSRQRNGKSDRSVLIDITNDSPIVGLAMGSLGTPSSFVSKRNRRKQTPGSGEALLRGQVKTLLQEVEEEEELSKLCSEYLPFLQEQSIVGSSSGLLAPTPANTPHVPNLLCNGGIKINPNELTPVTLSEAVTDKDGTKQETLDSQKSLITRSLLFDFFEKSEISDSSECSSVLTYQEGSDSREKSIEDENASIWSIQVNANARDEDEEEENYKEEGDHDESEEGEEEEEEGEDGGLFDELCEGLRKMSVREKRMPEFAGKHTRFVYNSDDEIEGEEVAESIGSAISPGILRLKGFPTPEGKHLRFPEEEEED